MLAAKLGRAVFGIFKLKRGIHVISGVSDLTSQLLSTRGELSKINLANTISSTLIGNPILSNIPGSFVQLSYENIMEGKVVQSYSDPNVIKGIVVGSMGSYFGAKYGVSLTRGSTLPGGKLIGESIFATTAAVYDKMTPF